MDMKQEIILMNNDHERHGKKISMLDFVEFLSSDSDSDIDINDKRTDGDADDDETVDDDDDDNRRGTNVVVDVKKANEKKKETLSLIHQLHTHIVLLEKEKKSLLHNKRKQEVRVYNELEELENKHNENRKKEKVQIQENLNKISTKILKFKRDKLEARKCTSYLEKLKLLMEDIEENIMQFKEKQRIVYEDLMADGKSVTTDIEAFDNKINSWQQGSSKSVTSNKECEKDKKEMLLPKEVEEFENFLMCTGGHQGGWDDIDHQTFLKLRKQYKKNDSLLTACVRDIPTQSDEDIEQHVQWYEEYCILRERKRESIRLWKNLKENEREDKLRNVELDNTMEETRRKKKEELLEKEREERLEKLKAYKAKKQFEEFEEQKLKENVDKQVKETLKVNHMMEEKKRLELKLQVEEYKMKKKEEEDILKQAQEKKIMEQKLFISEEEKIRIKERNDKLVTWKQQHKQTKQHELEEKEKRLERLKQQVVVNVERDPNRLYKLTAGWEHRKEDNSKSNSIVAGSRQMPHRAVPSWRQGMS